MRYDVAQLDEELRAAGVPVGCVSGSERGDVAPRAGEKLTEAHLATIASVRAAHVPGRRSRLARLGLRERDAALVLVLVRGANAPAWAREILAAEAARIETALR